ncbi:MAG: bifunctional tRNA (5-methylaminomethyl-2-thiouridine)(34)-methyltransferase MnmD/FAD-dependent 5-carboxymethylaminomethyl-2-thiouridine(34) oxidoreductase MnmC [Gammaproteobacteria bacterium]|nr:bifunctional tRNA (5-methylaminomethyl-2-thiouridine)(34)-methyltransferase MnmD/FAD-dependent 5-carboxymethylaminomethyl-2-thiouridine(34) oxidoreductase MnmC [Gammaproteobacteria bacterium]
MILEIIDQTPYSSIYQDVYFSRENGLEESRHVFLRGNDLPVRWVDKPVFTIAETGFGTGINFLATWQLWRRHPGNHARLHYISLEKYPLDIKTLRSCHALFPELDSLSMQLCQQWPGTLTGFHRCFLDAGRITLTLCHGEAHQVLSELIAKVDCWYLDGFSPTRNPGMWSKPVFREIARLSNTGTTIATFTVASMVRQSLLDNGFHIRKAPGFGRKREMLAGVMESKPNIRIREPWYFPEQAELPSKTATVVGAGIAGAQSAYHLARRGWQVTVLEQESSVAMQASGSPAAVYSPYLTACPSLEEQLSLQGFMFLLNHLNESDPDTIFHDPCGLLTLAIDEAQRLRQEKISARSLPEWLVQPTAPDQAELESGVACPFAGLLYPKAGAVNPGKWIKRLLAHENIELRLGKQAFDILHGKNGIGIVDSNQQILSDAAVVILATGHTMEWPEVNWIPFTRVSGQSTFVDAELLLQSPKCILRYGGYLLPASDGRYLIGSTFARGNIAVNPTLEADKWNLRHLETALPHLINPDRKLDHGIESAHNGVRMVSENRLPLVGTVPEQESFSSQFQSMQKRNYPSSDIALAYHPGWYLSAAWGSHGMTGAALGGEFLASWIANEPLPLQASLVRAIHPARSLVRNLKRKKPQS